MAKPTRAPRPSPLPEPSDEPLDNFAHWVQTNGKSLGIGAVVLAIAGVAVWGIRASDAKKAANASTALYAAQAPLYENNIPVAQTALDEVATRYQGTTAGEQATLLLAQTYYDAGEFEQGIEKLEAARSGASAAFTASMEALMAAGYEGMFDFDKAAAEYASAANSAESKTERDGYRLMQARALVRANKTAEAEAIFEDLLADRGSPYSQEAAVRLGEMQAKG